MKEQENRKQTIMAVDDTPANLRLLNEILQTYNYRLLTIPNGPLALKAAKKDRPDIILLDINMPEMNGYEVCKELKLDDELKDIPVLFLSAYTETEDKVKAFEAGGVDYVSKPFQENELLARIKTHLQIHQQQQEIEKKNCELEKLMGLRDNLTQMIVHDLRSPLTAMSGSLDVVLMVNESDLESDALKLIGTAKNSTRKMIEMVSSLLDLNRLEAGGMPLEIKNVEINQLLDDAIDLYRGSEKNIKFTIDTPGKPFHSAFDNEMIRRVLINLVSNAIKFSPEKSEIILRVEEKDKDLIFKVIDQGPGIPDAYRDLIFEKYGQIEARKSGYSSGIGLAFCKLAVNAHNGEIYIESEEGKGSTFIFSLPKSILEEKMLESVKD